MARPTTSMTSLRHIARVAADRRWASTASIHSAIRSTCVVPVAVSLTPTSFRWGLSLARVGARRPDHPRNRGDDIALGPSAAIARASLARLEGECGAVDAVAGPGCFGLVGVEVAEVTAAAPAGDRGQDEELRVVLGRGARARQRLAKGGPAGAAVELVGAIEKRPLAADAMEDPRPALGEQRARARRLAAARPQYAVLHRGQQPTPLRLAAGERLRRLDSARSLPAVIHLRSSACDVEDGSLSGASPTDRDRGRPTSPAR